MKIWNMETFHEILIGFHRFTNLHLFDGLQMILSPSLSLSFSLSLSLSLYIYIYIYREREREGSYKNTSKIKKQRNNSQPHIMWAQTLKKSLMIFWCHHDISTESQMIFLTCGAHIICDPELFSCFFILPLFSYARIYMVLYG